MAAPATTDIINEIDVSISLMICKASKEMLHNMSSWQPLLQPTSSMKLCTSSMKLIMYTMSFYSKRAAANGLQDFSAPAADPPRICLLDAVLPMNTQKVLRYINVLTEIKNDNRYALASFSKACHYYNRCRPVDERCASQYYPGTLEWRVST
ncbi:hypothetical protein GJ496_003206 [Pomphorhynchus laevis]|nr:hypothetical protein GJ496_003206 [Pomphorhynchus laevis]